MVTSSPNLRMDGGIRCWGVCLTSALIQMITIGVSNCFGVIKQVNDNKSWKKCTMVVCKTNHGMHYHANFSC